jgi:hypothetical protein
VIRVRAFSASAGAAFLFLLACASGHAQAPQASSASPQVPQPVTGFVSRYEIMRTVRGAGFDPVSPPLREGTSYVLRATDYRGVLMRVVIDARSGAIRDATRIVPGPGYYGQAGMVGPYGPPPYGGAPYGPPPYGATPYGAPPYGEPETTAAEGDMPARPAAHLGTHPSVVILPPLPRPRPSALAKSEPKSDPKQDPKLSPPAGAAGEAAATDRRDTRAAAPATVQPQSPAAASKTPTIND